MTYKHHSVFVNFEMILLYLLDQFRICNKIGDLAVKVGSVRRTDLGTYYL